jgi:hypothetical protein
MLTSADLARLTIEPLCDSMLSSSLMNISGIGCGRRACTIFSGVVLSGYKVSKTLSSWEYLELIVLLIS